MRIRRERGRFSLQTAFVSLSISIATNASPIDSTSNFEVVKVSKVNGKVVRVARITINKRKRKLLLSRSDPKFLELWVCVLFIFTWYSSGPP